MKNGNAALFLMVVSAIALTITATLTQHEVRIRRAAAVACGAPTGAIVSAPPTARVGERIEIVAQVDDADHDLVEPLSNFSNAVKLYYSKSVSASNPNDWTEITASGSSYQCSTDATADHCRMFAQWTPTAAGQYIFMVSGMDLAGHTCSGNPFFTYSGQTEWVRCSTTNTDWKQIIVSNVPPVAGHVRSVLGAGLSNVSVAIIPQGIKEYIVKTDTQGYFSLDNNDVAAGTIYDVRLQSDPPTGFINPPKTTNVTHSLNTSTGANTPLGSIQYTKQKVGQQDCGKIGVSGVGCDFEYAPVVVPDDTPTPSPSATPTATLTPTRTPTPTQTPTPPITVTEPPVSISPSVRPTGCLKTQGDADCSGTIGISDFAIWRQEFIGGCTHENGTFSACGEDRDGNNHPMDADFDGDGRVTITDFVYWRRSFLQGSTIN